jgi:DNA-binding PadR family transcriptional regulator
MRDVLDLAILGFLAEGPLHGYELRTHIGQLTGHVRPVSDGALYPAIKRLEKSGRLRRQPEPGLAAAPRHTLSLTEEGRAELLRRLRGPEPADVTDRNRFVVVLAFLSQLPDVDDQVAVLRRRRELLDQPASFFSSGGKLVRAEDTPDRYRKGMLLMAGTIRRAEIEWLDETISDLERNRPTAKP